MCGGVRVDRTYMKHVDYKRTESQIDLKISKVVHMIVGFNIPISQLIPYFEHKEIFLDSKDCHWLGFQSQLDHLMANFDHKEVFC